MDTLSVAFLVVIVLVIVVFASMMLFSVRKTAKETQQAVSELGFTPVQDTTALAQRIFPLYHRSWMGNDFRLEEAYRKVTPDAEVYLFSLLDMSGDDSSITEKRAVAILSQYLKLPFFSITPKIHESMHPSVKSGAGLGELGNKLMEWAVAKTGTIVNLPEFPEFHARYTLIPEEDPARLRGFFERGAARYLSQTHSLALRCNGDLFTFSEINAPRRANEKEDIQARVSHALEIARALEGR